MTNKGNFKWKKTEKISFFLFFIFIFGKPVFKYIAAFWLHCLPMWKRCTERKNLGNMWQFCLFFFFFLCERTYCCLHFSQIGHLFVCWCTSWHHLPIILWRMHLILIRFKANTYFILYACKVILAEFILQKICFGPFCNVFLTTQYIKSNEIKGIPVFYTGVLGVR